MVAKRKDGSTFDAEVLGSLTLNDRGQPIGMAASCLDVTARNAAEERLAHFSAIVNSSQDAIIGKTLHASSLPGTPVPRRLYGYTAAEMIGQQISNLELRLTKLTDEIRLHL